MCNTLAITQWKWLKVRHDLLVKSRVFKHAQYSGRFSAFYNSHKSSALLRWDMEQPGGSRQRQEVTYSLRCRDHVTWHSPQFILRVGHRCLSGRYSFFFVCFFFSQCVACYKGHQPPPLLPSPAVLTHWLLLDSYGQYTRRSGRESP